MTDDDRILVRLAATQTQTIQFQYEDEKGAITTRECEPYSWRLKSGEVLYGHDRMRDGTRSYRTDRMSMVTITENIFIPRYPIEIG